MKLYNVILGDYDVETAIDKLYHKSDFDSDELVGIAKICKRFISLVLYICSSEPDFTNNTNEYPSKKLKKANKGTYLVPRAKVKRYIVGKNLGDMVRQARSKTISSGEKSTHIRKAHWHGYWSGPKGEQKFDYKWLYPILVKGGENAKKRNN